MVVAVVELAAASYLREREEGLVLAVAFEDHLDLAGDQEVAVGARRALLDDHGPRREVLRREHFGDAIELLRGAEARQRFAPKCAELIAPNCAGARAACSSGRSRGPCTAWRCRAACRSRRGARRGNWQTPTPTCTRSGACPPPSPSPRASCPAGSAAASAPPRAACAAARAGLPARATPPPPSRPPRASPPPACRRRSPYPRHVLRRPLGDHHQRVRRVAAAERHLAVLVHDRLHRLRYLLELRAGHLRAEPVDVRREELGDEAL